MNEFNRNRAHADTPRRFFLLENTDTCVSEAFFCGFASYTPGRRTLVSP